MPSSQYFIVVGAGVFGATTALGLARLGHRVTVLERSPDGYAAPDSASNDINKIIRSDYSNPHYELLAKWAIDAWKKDPLLAKYYHDTGFVLASRFNRNEGLEYVRTCLGRGGNKGASTSVHVELHHSDAAPYSSSALASPFSPSPYEITSRETINRAFPSSSHAHLGTTLENLGTSSLGYCNPEGGWAEAGAATNAVLDQAKALGAEVVGGVEASGLIFDTRPTKKPPRVKGVVTADSRQFHADKVVLAPGAWMTSLLKQLLPEDKMWQSLPNGPCRASAQTVLSFQLNEEARKRYHGTPVVLDFSTGFYVFPPNREGVVKCAVHGPGYHYPSPGKLTTDPADLPAYAGPSAQTATNTIIPLGNSYRQQHQIEDHAPEHTETLLRTLLYDIWPEIATLPQAKRRVCWYSDSSSEDENWIFDWHPRVEGLFLAGAGSGHGFKVSVCAGSMRHATCDVC